MLWRKMQHEWLHVKWMQIRARNTHICGQRSYREWRTEWQSDRDKKKFVGAMLCLQFA
jgi:hypothetical protein